MLRTLHAGILTLALASSLTASHTEQRQSAPQEKKNQLPSPAQAIWNLNEASAPVLKTAAENPLALKKALIEMQKKRLVAQKNQKDSHADIKKSFELMRTEFLKLNTASVNTDGSVGIVSFHGSLSRETNQDAEIYETIEVGEKIYTLLGIFDGHGGRSRKYDGGRLLSDYVAHRMATCITDTLAQSDDHEQMFKAAYEKIDNELKTYKIDHEHAGSTGLTALVDTQNTLTLAHAGDSRALLIDTDGTILYATQDHKPSHPREQERIINAGGFVMNMGFMKNNEPFCRVNGILAVARGFGDFGIQPEQTALKEKKIVTSEPDVTTIKDVKAGTILVLACDGVWDAASNQEIAQKVSQEIKHGKTPQEVALQFSVYGEKSRDNVSAIIYVFE